MPEFNGNNKQGARDLMINRNVYNGYVLTLLDNIVVPTLETQQIKDFLKDEKMLYGRLDQTVRNTVFPNSTFLKVFPGSNEQGLNFVVDAFDDMRKRFSDAYRTGQISRDSKALSDLTVKKAYTSPLKEYDIYIEGTKKDFQRYVDNFNRIEEISDFGSFVPVFMEYINLTARDLPVTRTMFFLTRYISPRVSGLMFEIYQGDYGDDQLKVDLFYEDRNFEYLKNLAYTYGFVIDKHVPWRFVADLNSPRMTPYIRRHFGGTNPTAITVLTSAFTTTYPDDIDSIISLFVDTYNMFVAANPLTRIVEPSATVSPHSAKTIFANCKKVKTINRQPVDIGEIDLLYGTAFWLDLYARIRNIETNLHYSDAVLQEIINRSIDLSNSLDRPTALGYIASKFDNIEHFEGSLFHDVTRLEMSSDPSATEASVAETVRRSVQASNFVVY